MVSENQAIDASNLKKGQHTCSIYTTKDEKFSILIPYFKIGLANNEKCMYIFSDNSKSEVISEFKKRGFDLEKPMKAGKFVFISAKDLYNLDEGFNPDKVIDSVKELNAKIPEQELNGIRISAEMTWGLDKKENEKRMKEYESKLNQFFPDSQMVTICQYDENKFSQDFLMGIIHTHEYIFFNGSLYENKYYYNPQVFIDGAAGSFPAGSYPVLKEDIINEA